MCLLLTGLIILLYMQERRHRELYAQQDRQYQRRARYASATSQIHDAFHQLRDATVLRMDAPANSEAFLSAINNSVSSFAVVFSTITGAPCRVCIKQLQLHMTTDGDRDSAHRDPRYMAVYDLSRSGGITRPPTDPSSPDWVDDNTDFEQIVRGTERIFFSNDLRELLRRGQYRNSHWTQDTIEKEEYQYLSTIVWPIRRTFSDPATARQMNAVSDLHDLFGFLCIDSREPDVFDRVDDVGLGSAYADTLFIVLKPWTQERQPRG
jgi:hypothetical protein